MPFIRFSDAGELLAAFLFLFFQRRAQLQHAEVVVLVIADAGRLVGQRPGGLDVDLHVGDHFGHGGQPLDRAAELAAGVGVGAGQPVGRLGHAQRLGGDAHPRPVHQRHHVGDQSPLPLADQPAGRVVEDQLAGGRAVDAQLVLQVADLHPLRPLGDEQAQAAAVGDFRLAAGQHQQDFAAAVGDEPLHAVEVPVALLVLEGPQPHGLQVAAGVGLGQHHRAGHFAAGEPRQHLVLDLVVGEGVDRLGDALQPEQVHQRGVGPADHLGGHRVDEAGAIQPAVLPRQGEAHQVGLAEPLEVLLHQRMQRDGAVLVERVAFAVDLLGVGGDHLAGHFADDLQHAAVVVHGVGRVVRARSRTDRRPRGRSRPPESGPTRPGRYGRRGTGCRRYRERNSPRGNSGIAKPQAAVAVTIH